MKHLNGLIAAVYTPMDEQGAIQPEMVSAQARWFAEQRIKGVYICGSTGESLSLSVSERCRMLDAWVTDGHRPELVIAHVGANAITDAIELASHATTCEVDAVSAMQPTFARPRQVADLVDHHARIAEAAGDRPYLLYDFPPAGGARFPMSEVLAEASRRIPTLAGVKFTTGDLLQLQLTIDIAKQHDLQVLFGHDEILLAGLTFGCRCAIGSTYNHAPSLGREVLDGFERGEPAAARAAQLRLAKLVEVLLEFGVLRTGKALFNRLGIPVGPPRAPEPKLTSTEMSRVMARIEGLDLPHLTD